MTNAQDAQDIWVLEQLRGLGGVDPKTSLVIEAGAGNGIHLSNSFLFERLGFVVVGVEPHPESAQDYRNNRTSPVIQKILIPDGGTVSEFVVTEEPYHSGMEHCFCDEHERVVVDKLDLPTMTTSELIKSIQSPWDTFAYLSLDTEGHEEELLEDLIKLNPLVITIEHNHNTRKKETFWKLARAFGYHCFSDVFEYDYGMVKI